MLNLAQDMQHKMWEITLDNKLHLTPFDPSPEQVLDIGTGNGKWVIDFGSTPHLFPKTY